MGQIMAWFAPEGAHLGAQVELILKRREWPMEI
jgi:hypothetical protein